MGAAKAQLSADGVTSVRGFLGNAETSELRVLVETIYRHMAAADAFPHPQMADHFRAWHGVQLAHMRPFLASRSPLLLTSYDRMVSLISQHARRRFGRNWRFAPELSYFRRHVGMSRKVPWHIDADAAGAGTSRTITIWLPLDRVGESLPSLDVIPGSRARMRNLPLLIEDDYRYRDDAFARAIGAPITPTLEPGDALVFDNFTLHRTQHIEGADILRTSCEFRFQRPLAKLRRVLGALRSRLDLQKRRSSLVGFAGKQSKH